MVYKIIETRQATQYWTYEVEAETAEAALTLIQEGEVDAVDYAIEDGLFEDMEYEVEEIRDNTGIA